MRHVIPIEIAAPNTIAVTRYPRQSAFRNRFFGIPKTFKSDFLPKMAIRIVAMTQETMANFA
jgi:hypothetical protein